mgnify:CR=1 FL=1
MIAAFFSAERKRGQEKNPSHGGVCMLEGLSWLRSHREAYCVTFAQGLDEAELLRRFGGDLSQARSIRSDDWETVEELQLFGEVVQVGWCNGWAFAYEDNGFRGTFPEVLRSVSARTVAVSVFRNVNAVTRFCYAEDGTIIADFDPIDPPFEDASPRVQALLHQAGITRERGEEDDEEDSYDFVEGMFVLAEAARVSLDRESLVEKPLLTSCIRNPLSDFVGDLLTRGGDEQTASRLLALLGDRWGYANRLLHILKSGQQKERQPHIHDHRPLMERLRTITDGVLRALLSVQITPVLLKALDEVDQDLRSAVIEVLQALICFDQVHDEEGARERLLALAERTESEVARPAALALGTLRDQRAVVPLLRILEGYSSLYAAWHRAGMVYSPAGQAVQLLGQLRATSAIEPLFNLLDSQGGDIDFQRALYKALAHIGGIQMVGRLLPLLQSQPQSMGECAVQQALLAALAQLNDPGIVKPLLKLLHPRPESLWESDFQLHLLKALGNLGDQRAIEPLVQRLNPNAQHPWEWSFQEHLAETLRQLGETRAELQAVEQAVHNWRKTVQFKLTVTYNDPMVRKQQGDQHMP